MKKIQIILGSSREGRNGEKVINWFKRVAESTKEVDLSFEVVDLKDWSIPFIESPIPPSSGQYPEGIVTEWSKKVAEADGYIIVTPEYNHGYPAVLKNALDVIYKEWNYKPVSFVSYGATSSGIRAVEQLKQVVLELRMYPLHEEVNIPFVWAAFKEDGEPVDENLYAKAEELIRTLDSYFKSK